MELKLIRAERFTLLCALFSQFPLCDPCDLARAPERTRTCARLSRTRPSSRSWAYAPVSMWLWSIVRVRGTGQFGRSERDECRHDSCHTLLVSTRQAESLVARISF